MKIIYPAIFHEDDDGIWVEFPDLDGCFSEGETIEEAFDNAKEALECHCLTLLEDTYKLPPASNMKSIEPGENAFVNLVEATLQYTEQQTVRKTLTIPGWMNDYAIKNGLNFSAILQEGIMEKINNS